MKRLVIVMMLFAQLMSFASCSPVTFTNIATTKTCTAVSPCSNPNGTLNAVQDFGFSQTKKVDILIVDDNSESMTVEQQSMADSFSNLISNLNAQGMDWQIAVTNTDVCTSADNGLCFEQSRILGAAGRFMGPVGSNPTYGNYIIRPTDANPAQEFANIIQRGLEVGSGDERGVYAASLAIFGNITSNQGFLRPNSNLAIIILSDENERSVGGNCPTLNESLPSKDPNNPYFSPIYPCDKSYTQLTANDDYQNFLNQFATSYSGTKSLSVSSIVILPGDSNCLAVQQNQPPAFTAHYGTVYTDFAAHAGGSSYSICNNGSGAFAQDVSNISASISNLPNSTTLTLPHVALLIHSVTYVDNGAPASYTFNPGTNFITLDNLPAPGRSVRVNYDY